MKKLSIEEKAKAYDKALKRAKDMLSYKEVRHEDMEYLFPELKESEDERIRKALIDYFSDSHATDTFRGIPWDSVVAWLEKQGEQKHTAKVEPKFKVGDWITNGDYTWKIVEVKPLDYILQSQDGNIVDDTISHVDEQFHSFTIQDAKNGDVLTYNDSKNNVWVCIFKKYANERVYDYCTLYKKEYFWERGNWNYLESFSYTPATKEQRDQLEKVMADAGYTFDFKEKVLKKIAQKPTWSEEDEKIIKRIDSLLYAINERDFEDIHAWLKSLKDRVQPKQEMREEDKDYINDLIKYFSQNEKLENTKEDIVIWLKSLKDRYTLKLLTIRSYS